MMICRVADSLAMTAKRRSVRRHNEIDIERCEQFERFEILRQHVFIRMTADVRRDEFENMVARNQEQVFGRVQTDVPRRVAWSPPRLERALGSGYPFTAF